MGSGMGLANSPGFCETTIPHLKAKGGPYGPNICFCFCIFPANYASKFGPVLFLIVSLSNVHFPGPDKIKIEFTGNQTLLVFIYGHIHAHKQLGTNVS